MVISLLIFLFLFVLQRWIFCFSRKSRKRRGFARGLIVRCRIAMLVFRSASREAKRLTDVFPAAAMVSTLFACVCRKIVKWNLILHFAVYRFYVVYQRGPVCRGGVPPRSAGRNGCKMLPPPGTALCSQLLMFVHASYASCFLVETGERRQKKPAK